MTYQDYIKDNTRESLDRQQKAELEKEAEKLILEDAKLSGWEEKEVERLRWSTVEVIAFMVQFKLNQRYYYSADEPCPDCGLSKDENGWCDCWQDN